MRRIEDDLQDACKALSLDAKKEALKYMLVLTKMSPAQPIELRLVVNAKIKM